MCQRRIVITCAFSGGRKGKVLEHRMTSQTFGVTSSGSNFGKALRQTAMDNTTKASAITIETVNRNF